MATDKKLIEDNETLKKENEALKSKVQELSVLVARAQMTIQTIQNVTKMA